MTELLTQKIENNQKVLEGMKKKKENLERQIILLERKIENQQFALAGTDPDQEVPVKPEQETEESNN